jgi:hypothetical protein
MLEGTDIEDNAFRAFAYVYQRIVGLPARQLEGGLQQGRCSCLWYLWSHMLHTSCLRSAGSLEWDVVLEWFGDHEKYVKSNTRKQTAVMICSRIFRWMYIWSERRGSWRVLSLSMFTCVGVTYVCFMDEPKIVHAHTRDFIVHSPTPREVHSWPTGPRRWPSSTLFGYLASRPRHRTLLVILSLCLTCCTLQLQLDHSVRPFSYLPNHALFRHRNTIRYYTKLKMDTYR